MAQRYENDWLGRAFGASLILHGVLALIFPLFAAPASTGSAPTEQISFVRVAHIAIAKRPRRQPLAPATRRSAQPPYARRAAHARRPATQRNNVGTVPIALGADRSAPAAAGMPHDVAVVASEQPRPLETGAPNVPAANSAPNSTGKKDVGGVMPFGADLPEPVLDPKVRAELVRRFASVHVTLLVTVGDDGRTKNVEFHPPLDARLQAEISAVLAAANWDAAVCGGGIPCTGHTTITL